MDNAIADLKLQALRAERDRATDELGRIDLRIGQVTKELVEGKGLSRSEAARLLGVSHTHVSTLIERAAQAGPPRDPDWLTPIMNGLDAVKYLETTRRSILKIIAGFSEADVLLESGLHPRAFEQGAGYLYLPHMLWQLGDGDWLGVDDVSVGYLGTGPSNARRTLEDAGLSPELANEVASSRFSVTDISSGVVKGTDIWPQHPSGQLEIGGQAYIVRFEDGDLLDGELREYPSGSSPSSDGKAPLRQWVNYLDGDCPAWMQGKRVARVFLDVGEAISQGFLDSGIHGWRTYPLVIEQGELQLWIPLYPPHSGTQRLSPEVYEALAMAGLYPENLAARDARGRFWRYLDEHLHNQERPKFIDVSLSGSEELRSTPKPARVG